MPVKEPLAFLEQLRESQLLEPKQLEELGRRPEASQADPLPLARQAVQRGWLTKFQAQAVLQGRAGDLSVGPYLLLEKLGEGGMGQVYKARHRHMERLVALKLIRKEKLAKPESVKRFYQEVRAAAQLADPNIALAYDAGQAGTVHFLAMEYVEGTDLSRLVKESGPLPVGLACDYVRQAALGLQHAFERGLVHRDIKPANLLVTRAAKGGTAGGVVKVLDMGLARLSDGSEEGLTRDGQVLGTPDYLAPEQAADARAADVRSDLYGLGCTLYYLLAGRAPFAGGSLTEILLKHQLEEAPALVELRPDVPPGLDALVRKLLAKRPEDRYQTPAELARALEPFCRGGNEGIVALKRTLAPGKGRPEPPSDTLDTAGPGPRRRASRQDDTGATQTADRGASRSNRKGPREVRRPQPNRQRLLLIGAGGGAALAALLVVILVLNGKGKTTPTPAASPGGPGGQANLVEPPGGQPKPLAVPGPGPGGNPAPPAPVGVKPLPVVAVARPVTPQPPPDAAPGEIRRMNVDPKSFRPVALAPDGRRLLATLNPGFRVELWDLEAGKQLHDFGRRCGNARAIALSPDGTQVMTSHAFGDLALWDLGTGAEVYYVRRKVGSVLQIVYSRDGRQAFTAGFGDQVECWDVPTHNLVRSFDAHIGTIGNLALSPDARHLFARGSGGTFAAWDVSTGQKLPNIAPAPTQTGSAVFSPDCSRALLILNDGTDVIHLWDLEQGTMLRHFNEPPYHALCTAWSPDGRLVATGGGGRLFKDRVGVPDEEVPPNTFDCSVRVWDAGTGKELHSFKGHTRNVVHVGFVGGGGQLLSASKDGTVRVWQLPAAGPVLPPFVPPPAPRPEPNPASANLDLRPVARNNVRLPFDFVPEAAPPPLRTTVTRATDVPVLKDPKWRVELKIAVGTLILHPNGKQFLYSEGGVIRLAELATGQNIRELKGHTAIHVGTLDVSGDGTRLLSGGADRSVRFWDLQTGTLLQTFTQHQDRVLQVALSPDGTRGLSREFPFPRGPGVVYVLETATGKVTTSLAGTEASPITGAIFWPDGRRVLLCRGYHGQNTSVTLWDPSTGREEVFMKANQQGNSETIGGLTLSTDGEEMLFRAKQSLWLVKTRSGNLQRQIEVETFGRSGLAFSPDGRFILSCGGAAQAGKPIDCFIHVISARTGREVCRMDWPTANFSRAFFTLDGQHILSAAFKDLLLWELPKLD